MKTLKPFLFYWLPVLIWMVLIFYFSSRPRFRIAHESLFDFIIFKTLHMMAYGWLYFLLVRAFYKTTSLTPANIFLSSLLIAIFYAVSDEYHQQFVPTREGTLRDVLIDTAGIMITLWYLKNHHTLIKKIKI